jgi:hypothetical protein
MDEKILRDNIAGLEERLKTLRSERDTLIKVQGMKEQIVKLQNEAEVKRAELAVAKQEHAATVSKKNRIVGDALFNIKKQVNAFLPHGACDISVDEAGGVSIGWALNIDVPPSELVVVPYQALSGGDKARFDPALAAALKATVLIVEAAEIDTESLAEVLQTYAKADQEMQIIVNTWAPVTVAEGWEVVRL